jgi:hypothetical protein
MLCMISIFVCLVILAVVFMKEGWLLTHVLRFVDSEWPFRLLGRVSQVQAM